MPATDPYSVGAWTPVGREREYTTTVGATILLRNLEFDDIIELGILAEIDSISTLVQEEHIEKHTTGKRPTKKQIAAAEEEDRNAMLKLFSDREKARQISSVLDKVICRCVVAPQILDPYVDDPNNVTADNPTGRRKLTVNERDPEAAYADYIGIQDKMGIFGEVFQGMEHLENFREESQQDLGHVEDEPKPGNNSRRRSVANKSNA